MTFKKISRMIKITLPILIIIILLIVLFVYPGFFLDSYGMEPLANKRFTSWDNKNLADQLTPEQKIIEQAFRNNFLKNFKEAEQILDYQGVIRAVYIGDKNNLTLDDNFTLDNQLLWGKYLMLSGQNKEFNNWLEMLDKYYLYEESWALELNYNTEVIAKTENTWEYDLKYAEILIHAYNQNPSRKMLTKIENIMDRTWPYFEADILTPNVETEIEKIAYPEASSDSEPVENPELFDPYIKKEFIRLSDVNTYVLESFALIDKKWQESFETWSHLITDSTSSESTFYPYGIWPDQKNYISTANIAFRTNTYDNIRIIYNLSSEQENSNAIGFFNRQILQTNVFKKAYHISSKQSLSDQIDLKAMALFSEHLLKEDLASLDNLETIERIQSGLKTNQYLNDLSDLDKLFYQNEELGLTFLADNQLAILNSGLLR